MFLRVLLSAAQQRRDGGQSERRATQPSGNTGVVSARVVGATVVGGGSWQRGKELGRGAQPGAARAGRAAPRPAALLEAALGGLGGLRRREQGGELILFGGGHAGQPWIGQRRQTLGADAVPVVGPDGADLTGAGGHDAVVSGAVPGVRGDRQPHS